MSSNPPLILAQALGKAYRLYARPQDRLKHMLTWRFGRQYGHEFWALQDVSFELLPGEMLGVIGLNGSGKSTLLQMMAGILQPTSGSLQVNGRVAALLELGSGFSPELSGRENIYINAAVLGYSRAQIEEHVDDIIAFADIGEFIDQPVKLYSSGMFVRLAFAVSTGMNADILLVDEALAVGDIFFRQKCYKRLAQLREQGTSIVLVTHNMVEIEQFCNRALLLHKGHLMFLGGASEAVKHYYFAEQELRGSSIGDLTFQENLSSFSSTEEDYFWPPDTAFLDISQRSQVSSGIATCTGIAICDDVGQPRRVFVEGEKAVFYYQFELHQEIDVPIGGILFHSEKGVIVHGKNGLQQLLPLPAKVPAGKVVRFRQEVTLTIQRGEYTFEIALASMPGSEFLSRGLYPPEELRSRFNLICSLTDLGPIVIVLPKQDGIPYLKHYGLTDLEGSIEVFLK